MKNLEVGKFKFLEEKKNVKIKTKISWFKLLRNMVFKLIEVLIAIFISMVLVMIFYYFYFKGY